MTSVELDADDFETLDMCINAGPTQVADVGDDAGWWASLDRLRAAGYVAFDDDESLEIDVTDAGHAYFTDYQARLEAQQAEEDAEEDEDASPYDGDYIDVVDSIGYEASGAAREVAPLATEYADDWGFVEQAVSNGHVLAPDDGYLYITEAGVALVNDPGED